MNTRIRNVTLFMLVAAALILAGCGQAVARAPEASYTYVANAADGTLSAIDLTADQVAWTMNLGERAAHGIAASPDGNIVYTGDSTTNEVLVVDAQRHAIVKRIPLVHSVHGIDISPDGRTLWVGGSLGDDPVQGTLTAINTASNTIEDVISPRLGSASHFAFTPDGSEIWIASTSTNLVWIVDAVARRVTAAIPLALPQAQQRPEPGDDWTAVLAEKKLLGLNEVAISPNGKRAYAVGPATSELFAIDVKDRQVLKSVPAGQRAHGVTVSPDGKEVWIADWSGVVSVFDAESLKPLGQIQVVEIGGAQARGANHVAFGRDGQRVYVTGVGEVVVIDRHDRQILGRVNVGEEPHELSLEDWVAPDAKIDTAAILARYQDVPAAPAEQAVESSGKVPAEVPQVPTNGLTQMNDERSVVVEVTPLNLGTSEPTLDFQVALNTHSVELGYDLTKIAVLRDDQGNEYVPVEWDGGQGGHHVNGVLRFDGGPEILRPRVQYLELELKGIAQVPSRVFHWEFQ
jgi:DNA-binding beta-propeller fold protein YncE